MLTYVTKAKGLVRLVQCYLDGIMPPSPSPKSKFKITVHDFIPVGSSSTSTAALRLEKGRDLALACASSHRWVMPCSTIDPAAFSTCHVK